jgi:hypothetical protein
MSASSDTLEGETPSTGPEFKASFRILADRLDFATLSMELGVSPTRTHRAEDRDILGKEFGRDMWTFESPLARTASFDEHVTRLNSVLTSRIDFLRRIARNADLSVVCSYRAYETDQGGFSLSPATLGALDELGVRVEFHLMFI